MTICRIISATAAVLAAGFGLTLRAQIPDAADLPPATILTQTVVVTQVQRPPLAAFPAPPVKPSYKPWLLPGLGHAELGETARGVTQAVLFSSSVVASVSFFIAGDVQYATALDLHDQALATIDYTVRSNLFVKRDRAYNRYNVLTSYGEASLVAAGVIYVYSLVDYYYSLKRLRLLRLGLSPGPAGFTVSLREEF